MIIGVLPVSVLGWESHDWAEGFIEKAGEMGLIPDLLQEVDLTLPITRAEFAAVAVKLYENLTDTKAVASKENPFTDTKDTDVLKAYGLGITDGTSADKFSPESRLTREMAATMLTRVYKKYSMPKWMLKTDGDFKLEYEMPELFADDEQISNWAKDSVYFMAANNIVEGVGGNSFAPGQVPEKDELYGLVTCEQALIIAVRIVENLKEEPTDWEWDVFMAQNVYGFGDKNTYSKINENLTWEKLKPVLTSMTLKFGNDSEWVDDRYEKGAYITRGEVISCLFDIIYPTIEIKGIWDINVYFATYGLIPGNYRLNIICSVEEMIGLTVRAYEHIIHELNFDSKGFFWKVTGEHNIVYLLGSIHITDSFLYPLNKKIEAAFDSTSHLAVERDFDSDTEEDDEYYYGKAYISDGTTIADYLDPVIYGGYEAICDIFGFSQDFSDYIYPWFASMILDQIATGIMFANEDTKSIEDSYNAVWTLGIDNHFLNKALMQEKNIIGLETAKSRADMQASFSRELQEAILIGSLFNIFNLLGFYDDDPIEEPETSIFDLLDIWKSGDEKALIKSQGIDEKTNDPLLKEYNYKMLTERNKQMTEKIIEFLTEGEGDYFVVVGAAHMVGNDGIVKLLTKAGYKVERIK